MNQAEALPLSTVGYRRRKGTKLSVAEAREMRMLKAKYKIINAHICKCGHMRGIHTHEAYGVAGHCGACARKYDESDRCMKFTKKK